jgi:SAM-dependent methyltransferase
VLSAVPFGDEIHYGMQRHVTRSLRISERDAAVATRRAAKHADAWTTFGDAPLGDARIYEFGAGWHLGAALALARRGARHQIVTDLNPLMRRHLLAEMISALNARTGRPLPDLVGDVDTYLSTLGIDYRAPFDSAATGLPNDSVDLVVSAHVLEHVPTAEIPGLLSECRRILRPGGVVSFEINYQDHNCGTDTTIGPYNFLRFDDETWRRYDSRLHHQNRLRHHEYLDLFTDAGFTVRRARTTMSELDIEKVRSMDLAPRFAAMRTEDVAVRNAVVVLSPSN